jgi:hypothetical protein
VNVRPKIGVSQFAGTGCTMRHGVSQFAGTGCTMRHFGLGSRGIFLSAGPSDDGSHRPRAFIEN